jgi:hypothetical protein
MSCRGGDIIVKIPSGSELIEPHRRTSGSIWSIPRCLAGGDHGVSITGHEAASCHRNPTMVPTSLRS